MNFFRIIADELSLEEKQVAAVVSLIEEGGTVPFIARYRKERTGSLDEVNILNIRDRYDQLRELEGRKDFVIKSIDKQEKLTGELEKSILQAKTLAEVEDIYLPFKPKRKTRATVAREKGLEPLAERIFKQGNGSVIEWAESFINEETGVSNTDEALQGSRDIIAEWINEDAVARQKIRVLFEREAIITSRVMKGKETEGQKYRDYFEWSEPLTKTPSHRLLAMRRGEKEMILSLDISPDHDKALAILGKQFIQSANASSQQTQEALEDSYKRLIKPSLETEMRMNSKMRADTEAIGVFADNIRQLLLAAPMGQKCVLALDPGFRTGCKLVVLDRQGKLLFHEAIYPNPPQNQQKQSGELIRSLITKFKVEAIAIGNGTAGRETEQFVKSIGLPQNILIVMVNESGASVYSASEVARQEFPDYDVTVRGAVSIGRRLMDPLAELVKIDPKAIGVGQYQHDVDQGQLKKGLDDVVISCVNSVGVELNTASKELLSYVAGVGAQLAENIVKHRNENGAFKTRKDLLTVTRLGDKSFEQAAGFLRLAESENPLDHSGVHPETYDLVEKMARDIKHSVPDLIDDPELLKKITLKDYLSEKFGMPTLEDIVKELAQPGRDPRDTYEVFQFDESVREVSDLKVGMKLPGIVTNVTNFGAFVDIGVHQDGLIHISHMSDQFVKNAADILNVQQKVTVTVIEVDKARKRIALSLKSDPFDQNKKGTGKQEKKNISKDQGNTMQEKLKSLQGKFGK